MGPLAGLSLSGVSVDYDGVPAVVDVDLELPAGQVLAVERLHVPLGSR